MNESQTPANIEVVLNPVISIGYTTLRNAEDRAVIMVFMHPRFGQLTFCFPDEQAAKVAALISQILAGEAAPTMPAQMN